MRERLQPHRGRPRPPSRTGGGETIKRIVTGGALGAVFLGTLALGAVAVAALAAVFALVAVAELYDLQRARGQRPIRVIGFAAVIAMVTLAYVYGERAPQIFPAAVAGAFVLASATLVTQRRVEGAATSITASMLGVVYVGVLASYLVVIRRTASGTSLLFAVVLFVAVNDVASYAVGRWRGRHALAPTVSPRKSWEGLVAGTVATLVAAMIVGLALDPPFDRTSGLVLGAVCALAAPLGDLVESMMKREAGANDSGTVLPGHGGVLDRIDGLLVAAPMFFYAWRALAR